MPGLPAAVHRLLDDATARTTARHAQRRQRRRGGHTRTNAPVRGELGSQLDLRLRTRAELTNSARHQAPRPASAERAGTQVEAAARIRAAKPLPPSHVSQPAGPTGPHSLVSAGICGGCH